MRSGITLPSLLLSIVLHALLALLLVLNIQLIPHDIARPVQSVSIVKAVTVDSRKVDAELNRLKEIDRKKAAELKKKEEDLKSRLEDLQKKTAVAENRRKEEEKRLTEVQQKKEEQEKAREAEEEKVAELKKKQQDDLERKKKEETEKKKKEEEQKRKADEQALKKQMEDEQHEQDAERLRQEQGELDQYAARIQDAIRREFNTTGLPPGLSCVLEIRMIPGGEVVSVRISKSSGNEVFDQRAEVAVSKAAPLPVPDDAQLFEKMRELHLTFAPEP